MYVNNISTHWFFFSVSGTGERPSNSSIMMLENVQCKRIYIQIVPSPASNINYLSRGVGVRLQFTDIAVEIHSEMSLIICRLIFFLLNPGLCRPDTEVSGR